MRTAVIIAAGLALLGLTVAAGWRLGEGASSAVIAAKIFIPAWLVAALVNMWVGVSRAGYSVGDEFPIFLVIFVIPAAVAGVIWWKYS
jgi:hypothetical protein